MSMSKLNKLLKIKCIFPIKIKKNYRSFCRKYGKYFTKINYYLFCFFFIKLWHYPVTVWFKHVKYFNTYMKCQKNKYFLIVTTVPNRLTQF